MLIVWRNIQKRLWLPSYVRDTSYKVKHIIQNTRTRPVTEIASGLGHHTHVLALAVIVLRASWLV